MAGQPRYRLKEIDQVCVVVKDLQKAVESYWSTFGIGPWKIYTYAPPMIRDTTYMGKPAYYSMKVALAQVGSLNFEMIQPLEGESIYRDFVAQHGEGIHHLGFFVPNLDEAIREMEAQGFRVIQTGRGHGLHGDGGFAYLGTEEDLAAIFEIIEIPSARRPPEAVYP